MGRNENETGRSPLSLSARRCDSRPRSNTVNEIGQWNMALVSVGLSALGMLVAVPMGLVRSYVVVFAIQWLAFLPSVAGYSHSSERIYALTACLTIGGLAVGGLGAAQWTARRALAAALVCVWAARLASFFWLRMEQEGRTEVDEATATAEFQQTTSEAGGAARRRVRRRVFDQRFNGVRNRPWHFLAYWSVNGLRTFFVALPLSALLLVVPDSAAGRPLGWLDAAGLALWMLGFGVEVVADRQKSLFRRRWALAVAEGRTGPTGESGDPWIAEGLWAVSQQPNYAGEITLWVGLFLICASSFSGDPMELLLGGILGSHVEWLSSLGPVSVILLMHLLQVWCCCQLAPARLSCSVGCAACEE